MAASFSSLSRAVRLAQRVRLAKRVVLVRVRLPRLHLGREVCTLEKHKECEMISVRL
jgi:hypothetical protein